MLCRDYMITTPTCIEKTKPVSAAIDMMVDKHMGELIVVDDQGRLAGEIRAAQFGKLLAPATVGHEYGLTSDISTVDSLTEGEDQLRQRIKPHLQRTVAEFMDHEIPAVHPDSPLRDALMLLRGGTSRLAVIDPVSRKLVGAMSMFTVLRHFHS